MSRYSSIFSGIGNTTSTTSTTTFQPTTFNVNKYRNCTIEDLNHAIIENDEKTVMEILNANVVSVNQITRDPYKNTILHTAISCGNVKIIQKIIDMGADLRIKNKMGQTCADLLSKSHLGEVVQYLADKSTEQVKELMKEVKEKDGKIQVLHENVDKLEKNNNKLAKEKQDLEVEVGQLRKRKTELEESNSMLRQASKKAKN